ncbi:hypothetical protein O181_046480 [Austropuccinia psidii MF-1]|uniref:Uncharacterized protein n=1 Tax=Austropuccinia psidii MF-1 TaxID=1389203 RepID=A0A9Q3DTF8_9BASI|nr:hypothetical protein [Austropuccinia psidii MF-1]
MKCSTSYFVSSKDTTRVGCVNAPAAMVYCPKAACIFTPSGSNSTPDISFESCSIGNNKNLRLFPTSYTVLDQTKTITVFKGRAVTASGSSSVIDPNNPGKCTWSRPIDHNAARPVCAHCTHSPP